MAQATRLQGFKEREEDRNSDCHCCLDAVGARLVSKTAFTTGVRGNAAEATPVASSRRVNLERYGNLFDKEAYCQLIPPAFEPPVTVV